jgi:hypothetical protein
MKRAHLGHRVDLQGGGDSVRLVGPDDHSGANSSELPRAMQGTCKQMALTSYSPPCEAPGMLLVGG